MRSSSVFMGLTMLAAVASVTPAAAWTETTLHIAKGPALSLGLLSEKNGALYGTGGDWSTWFFELVPPAIAGKAWSSHVIYKFSGSSNGSLVNGGMVTDRKGALYGTASCGGINGKSCAPASGTVFMLSPPSIAGGAWTETTLHSFTGGSDGSGPTAGLLKDSSRKLYGTTEMGGSGGAGTVFMLTPPAVPGGVWTETILHAFTAGTDGSLPIAGLIKDSTGTLYGVTAQGGTGNNGTVFKLVPPAVAGNAWTETVLYAFGGGNDGSFPNVSLIKDKSGALYGTTNVGGGTGCLGHGCGIIFMLTPPAAADDPWTESVLYRFAGSGDGSYPQTNLVKDKTGGFYGTTLFGGKFETGCNIKLGCGTMFHLRKPPEGSTTWTETVIYKFGASPYGELFKSVTGSLYGITGAAGKGDACTQCDIVFELSP